MGCGLVKKWVGQGFVYKMGWLEIFFFFCLKKVDNAEGLYWVTFEIGSMGYLQQNDSEQVKVMAAQGRDGRCSWWVAATGAFKCV